MFPIRLFDPDSDVAIIERRLPHWSQPGVVTFVTFRTHDSMPQEVVNRWHQDRMAWLLAHDIDPTAPEWSTRLRCLERDVQTEFHRTFSDRWHAELDLCYGQCVLRRPPLSQIVADSLEYFDGQRYELTDYVVMPNHVHVLAAFPDEEGMLAQCESWKHFTATRINRELGVRGRFWQQDGFDHLVRSLRQFEGFRKYIRENPEKSQLPKQAYRHYSSHHAPRDESSPNHAKRDANSSSREA